MSVNTGLLAVIVTILSHAAASIWWASKVNNTLSNIADSLGRLDKELEKRDARITAIGSKLDDLKDRVIILEHNGNNK